MRRAKLCLSLVAFGHLCAVATAQEQRATVVSVGSVGSETYITHVTVIDTETGKEAQDRTVVISGDRISEIKRSKGIKPPAGAKVWETNQLASGFDLATSLMTQAHIIGLRKGDCKDIVALAREAQQVSHLEFIQRDAQELVDD